MTEPHVAVLSQVQQFLDRQHGLYIDGRPGPAQSEKRLAIFDPATGQEIASTADATKSGNGTRTNLSKTAIDLYLPVSIFNFNSKYRNI